MRNPSLKIFGKLAGIADRLTGSNSTRTLINRLLEEYGQLNNLKIDRKNKTVTASISLRGENAPIQVRIEQIEFSRSGETGTILIRQASSDKEWIDAILKNLVAGKTFSLPADKIGWIEELLR